MYLVNTPALRTMLQGNQEGNVVTVAEFDDTMKAQTYITVFDNGDETFDIHRTFWTDTNPVEPVARYNHRDVSWNYIKGYVGGFIEQSHKKAERRNR
jgi:hypothetical protein